MIIVIVVIVLVLRFEFVGLVIGVVFGFEDVFKDFN